jgi:hypothetical protein
MLNGTKTAGSFLLVHSANGERQGAFPESYVRYVYPTPDIPWIFHSKYVSPQKGLKGSIKLDKSEMAFFCRVIPLSLWGGSLLAVAWGGMLCQLGND